MFMLYTIIYTYKHCNKLIIHLKVFFHTSSYPLTLCWFLLHRRCKYLSPIHNWCFPIWMVIFHCYVNSPEGSTWDITPVASESTLRIFIYTCYNCNYNYCETLQYFDTFWTYFGCTTFPAPHLAPVQQQQSVALAKLLVHRLPLW